MSKVDATKYELSSLLEPFHKRADLAEERLTKLEAVLMSSTGDSAGFKHNGLLDSLVELRSKLEAVKDEQAKEREEVRKEHERLATENSKLQYRILHLLRALKEADEKLANTISV